MTKVDITKDNQGENGINEEPLNISILPKKICNALPNIKQLKVTNKNYANVITYGRDYEEICPHCGRKFSDHETLRYSMK